MSRTEILIDRDSVENLMKIFNEKFMKGDIQAQFDLKDLDNKTKIFINLKQLFVLIQALIHVPGKITLEEIKEDKTVLIKPSSSARQLYICRDGVRIKDISTFEPSSADIKIHKESQVINARWERE